MKPTSLSSVTSVIFLMLPNKVKKLYTKLTQNCRNFKKPSKLKKSCQKTMFSYTFSNIPQFGLNIRAPNHQNIVKGVLPDIWTPLAPLGARQ